MYLRDTLLKDLRKSVIEITFMDQSIRRYTLRPELLPKSYIDEIYEEKEFHENNPNVISAWDINAKKWAPFLIGSVAYVNDVNENY